MDMTSNNFIIFGKTKGKSALIETFVKSDNGKKIILFQGNRDSFRCRQRSRMMDGNKIKPLKFVSYKETMKQVKRGNTEKVIGPLEFNTVAKL
jgi:hypothetical protein